MVAYGCAPNPIWRGEGVEGQQWVDQYLTICYTHGQCGVVVLDSQTWASVFQACFDGLGGMGNMLVVCDYFHVWVMCNIFAGPHSPLAVCPSL